jgi:hypothetical protein
MTWKITRNNQSLEYIVKPHPVIWIPRQLRQWQRLRKLLNGLFVEFKISFALEDGQNNTRNLLEAGLSKAVEQLNLPSFPLMIRQFLYDQLYPDSEIPSSLLEVTAFPDFNGRISIFYSATATFRAPSDISGVNGMRREYI